MECKKKIIIFVQDGVGGAERMSVLIGKNLDPVTYDVCFCLIERNVGSSIADFIPPGMRIMSIPNENPLMLMWNMLITIIKEKPYAVFSSVINLNNKYLPFRWLFPKVKVIIRCDNYYYTYSKKQQRIIRLLYPKADFVIAQTQEMADELTAIGVCESKVVVLQNPVDRQTIDRKLERATNPYVENGKKHLVAVGRFNPQKGFDLLIESFIRLRKLRKDVDLTIVGDYLIGDGKIYKDLMAMVQKNNLSEDVHCVGYKDNPYVYIKNADCFVLSSRWEGLPNVLIESLYLGTPAAAFKCIPVIERIVEHGKTGYCADKECVDSLVEATIKTLKLGKIESTYKSSSIEDFTRLFDN